MDHTVTPAGPLSPSAPKVVTFAAVLSVVYGLIGLLYVASVGDTWSRHADQTMHDIASQNPIVALLALPLYFLWRVFGRLALYTFIAGWSVVGIAASVAARVPGRRWTWTVLLCLFSAGAVTCLRLGRG